MDHLLTINGIIPSKKNSRINTRSGRSFPSAAYTKWHKEAIKTAKQAPIIIGACFIDIYFFLPDYRRRDLTNMAESIMDLLVDAGIIKDDCWTVVEKLQLHGCLDKDNPRAVIFATTARQEPSLRPKEIIS